MKKIMFLSLFVVLFSCNRNNNKQLTKGTNYSNWTYETIRFDTLAMQQRLPIIDSLLLNLDKKAYYYDNYSNYLKGYSYYLKSRNAEQPEYMDSAVFHFKQIKPIETDSVNWKVIQDYFILESTISNTAISESRDVEKLLDIAHYAEKNKSIFLFRIYDLQAKTAFMNKNTVKAYAYLQKYYDTHPFKNNSVVTQRYNDLSFLIAEGLKDTVAMRKHFEISQKLALETNDSVALARAMDHESQLLLATGKITKSLDNYRAYFKHLQKENNLHLYSFSDLAYYYMKNNQPDSAIVYYKKGIAWAKQNDPKGNLFNTYKGLQEIYLTKHDYKNAYLALDSAMQINYRNQLKIQAEKIEELEAKYKFEEKNQTIKNLETTNTLNYKIIAQQRWIFMSLAGLLIVGGLLLYNNYRRKWLVSKNEKLELENKKLYLEQKVGQIQLNPHFIYNSIANLQGLIANNEKKEANSYLLSLSKLMRNILELNRNAFITLKEEFDALENYMVLQQKRFYNKFDYQINVHNIDTDNIMVPPMLLQPFVENAIEHGFKGIEHKGKITITSSVENNKIIIRVLDNGNGVEMENQSSVTKKSLSKTIIQERLDLLFNTKEKQAWFTAGPLPNKKGYKVELVMPVIEI
ncbi:MAG: histidine kinase [Flavobacteriaceae bacterium]